MWGGEDNLLYMETSEKKKNLNFHSIFAFSLRDKLKPETNMRKKAAAQREGRLRWRGWGENSGGFYTWPEGTIGTE